LKLLTTLSAMALDCGLQIGVPVATAYLAGQATFSTNTCSVSWKINAAGIR
jgi:hypothetical protein